MERCVQQLFSCLSLYLLLSCDAYGTSSAAGDLKTSWYSARIADPAVSVQDRLQAYDSLIKWNDIKRKDSLAAMLRIDKSLLLDRMGRYAAALLEKQAALAKMDSLADAKGLHFPRREQCLFDMARMAVNTGLYEQGTSYLYGILSEEGVEASMLVRAYSLLSCIYINLDKPLLAERCLHAARTCLDSLPRQVDSLAVFDFLNNAAALQYYKKNYDSALVLMARAGQAAEYCGIKAAMTYCYNMSNIHLDLGNLDLAKQYLFKVLDFRDDNAEPSYMYALAAQNVAYIFFLEKDYVSALHYYDMALGLAREISAKKIMSACLLEVSEVYHELGDCQKAWAMQRRGYELHDSVFNVSMVEEILIQNNNFVSQKRELEKQLMEQELKVATLELRNKRILLSVLIGILACLVVLLFFSLHKMMRQEKNIRSAHEEMENSTRQLGKNIEDTNRKMLSNSLRLAYSEDLLSRLKAGVKRLKALNTNTACKEVIDELALALNEYKTGANWDEFECYFERVTPAFFQTLSVQYPDLTRNEQRVCALLWLGLNVKEIANLTFRSYRTVETVVHSIRKKMGIPLSEKTRNFLLQIGGEPESVDIT